MHNCPFVSVVIPTYNRKNLCKRAICSVLNQTYTDYELIVVDDCSDDNTSEDCLFDNTQNRNCIYIRQKVNSGVAKARNTGVVKSKGEWVAFLDSDDEWHKRKLEKQVEWIRKNPECKISQTKEIWIRKGVRVNPPKTHEKIAGDIFKESLKRCMVTSSSVIIKKDFFDKLGGFNESLPACEDYDLWLRIALHHPIGLLREYLLTRYGGHSDQLSSKVQVLDKYRIRALLNLLENENPDMHQRKLICKILITKCEIVASGLKKRNRMEEYERYRKIAYKYRDFIY